MRIVMMGTGPFAVPTFHDLLKSTHDVVALITRPVPPPTGRRRKGNVPNPMRDVATAANLETHAPNSINAQDFADSLRAFNADLFVVCDYGQILSADTLSAARFGGINLHASLLPKYRGAAPINWAIYHGEQETGVTVIHMTPRLDAGPAVVQLAHPIPLNTDAVELENQLAVLGVDAVRQSISMLATWNGHIQLGKIQDNSQATRAPRLKKSDGNVNWQRTAVQIRDQVRAFRPWPGTYTHWQHPQKGPLRLTIGEVAIDEFEDKAAPPGVVVGASDHLSVATGQRTIRILQIQPAGKRMLSAEEFLRGYPVRVGEIMGKES